MSKLFPKNEARWDRIARVVVGLVLLSLPFLMPAVTWAWAGLIGIIPLVTGLAGTCPIYTMLGVSSCPMETKAEAEAGA